MCFLTYVAHVTHCSGVGGTLFCSLTGQELVTASCHRGFWLVASLFSHQHLRFAALYYHNAQLLYSSTDSTERNLALQFSVHISCGSVHTANVGEHAGKDAASVRVTRHTGTIGLVQQSPAVSGQSGSGWGVPGGPWVMGPP